MDGTMLRDEAVQARVRAAAEFLDPSSPPLLQSWTAESILTAFR